ncbi:target of Myb1 membrane trafficking protein-like isoform X2 [Myxocyprinus asiaticus]|uniref:target of Myb1 membrane trafficking protein-like isoform X2 n=1 Tax=Myxocyprinus asiaticus TaxID=70543 RepID=UPI0022217C50|nr:target of Myb1 membrane trafficking protein-like isoform X2 [Myxocyprinus asiaticus]
MEFFIGNPFSTPVGQLIEHATSSSLPSEDWGLNMEICDIVNETEDGPKDAVRAIKKRILGNRNFKEVMLALSVLEACVKNCCHKFHVYVSTRDFVENVLVQTLLPKNNPPMILQNRVLSMIQAWSDAFRSSPDLTGVVTVYEDLRRRGVEFPVTELNGYSPIHTPNRSVDSMSPVTAHAEQHTVKSSQPQNTETPLTLSPQQSKQLKAELEMVRNNLSVMSDMMSQMEPGSVQQSDTELLQQLYSMCKHMQGRMVDLIPRLTDEKLTEQLLMVNDDMNTTFAQYHRFERHLNIQSNAQSSPAYTNLIDLGAASETLNQSKAANSAHCAVSQSTVNILSNQMAGLSTKADVNKHSSLQKSPETSSALGGLDATQIKRQDIGAIPVDQSEVMDDIERWLDVDNQDDFEGVTSEEFDKFLAERAKAADRLPSATMSLHDPGHSQP